MKKIELPKEDRTAWLEALRSGEYKQTKQRLYKDGGYCCLGVICRLKGIDTQKMLGTGYPNGLSQDNTDKLPEAVVLPWDSDFRTAIMKRPECNIKPNMQEFITYLATLNDDFDMSFEEIADEIELLTVGV